MASQIPPSDISLASIRNFPSLAIGLESELTREQISLNNSNSLSSEPPPEAHSQRSNGPASNLSLSKSHPSSTPAPNPSQPSTRWNHRTRVELAAALEDPNDPYKGPKKSGQKSNKLAGSKSSRSIRSASSLQDAHSEPHSEKSTIEGNQVQFTLVDYEYICTYLEDSKNFHQLFGSGSQTTVGSGQMTRSRALERFADYMNIMKEGLNLTGNQLRLQLLTYKNNYRKAKDF